MDGDLRRTSEEVFVACLKVQSRQSSSESKKHISPETGRDADFYTILFHCPIIVLFSYVIFLRTFEWC